MKNLKKALAMVLAVVMVFSMSTINAFANVSGTGTQTDPIVCETMDDMPETLTLAPGDVVYYTAPVGGKELTITSDSFWTNVCVLDANGNQLTEFPGESYFFKGVTGDVTFALANMGNPMFGAAEENVTLEFTTPVEGSKSLPKEVSAFTGTGRSSFIMNDALTEGDNDGYWYTFKADSDGIICVTVSCSADVAYDVYVETESNTFMLSDDGNPIITYPVAEGETILVNKYVEADLYGKYAAAQIYVSATIYEETTDEALEAIPLTSVPVKVPVAGSETIYVVDGLRGDGLFGGCALAVSNYFAEYVANTVVTINDVEFTDEDGDGTILISSDNLGDHQVIGITNNNAFKLKYTLDTVKLEANTNHVLEYHETVEASCDEEGMNEYYYCAKCDVFYGADGKLTNARDLVIPAGHYKTLHFEEKAPACHYNGNVEYWYCPDCEGFWTDEACTRVTNSKSVILGATGSENVVHFDAVEAGCHYDGNQEYWICYDCEQVWQDAALTQTTNIKNVVVPAKGGEVEHFAAVEPSCHYDGNIEYWVCYTCEKVWTDEALTQVTNIKNVVLPATGEGEVLHFDRVEPGCHDNGNIEYWTCNDCGQVWQNEALTQLTNRFNVILPATGEGTLVHMEAVEPGCHYDGNQEYWICYDCTKVWADEALTQLTNIKNVVLPATGEGNLVHMEAVEPGCHSNGNQEYWVCYDCEQVWADEALTQVTNIKNVVLPATGSGLVHMEAVEPGCHYNGNVEYWYCPDCEGFWLDEACTQLTNAKSVVLPATREGNLVHMDAVEPGCHDDGNIEYWVCYDCKQVWQDEALTQLTNIKNVVLPATGGEVVHVDAVSSCVPDEDGNLVDGNIEYWYCEKCLKVWQDEALTQLTNIKNVMRPAGAHNLVHFDAVEPGCHSNGNVEYWFCTSCEGFWTDEECTKVTNSKSVILPATGKGNVVHMEAVAPGCHNDGNIEYWVCYTCEQVWQNEALTQLTNIKNVVLPATGGEVVHMEALEPGCHSLGNIEYWYCEECEQVWQDKALTQLTNHKNVILGATGSDNVKHVAAVAPTYNKDGNVEYWYCADCKSYYLDEACTQLTNAKRIIVPATGEEVIASTSSDKHYTESTVLPEDAEEYKAAVEVMDEVIKDKSFSVIEINLYTLADDTQVHEVGEYISVTIPVPTDIVVKEGQILVVYRINDDGTYTKCDTTVNGDELTFKTNHFSTFVVVAEDVVVEDAVTEDTVTEETAPDTGDATNIALWIAILGLGVVAIAGSVVMKKREF